MDFMLSDISSSFVNMLQQDFPKEVMTGSQPYGEYKRPFSEEFKSTLKGAADQGRTIREQAAQSSDSSQKTSPVSSDAGVEQLSHKLDRQKGYTFVSTLKSILLALSGGDLKNIQIDSEGIEMLKKLLVNAGFKQSDIDEMLEELSADLEQGTLPVDELFNKILALPFKPAAQEKKDVLLDASLAPFFESMMTSLGIAPEKIDQILQQAGKSEDGIDLDEILHQLKALRKQAFYSGESYTTDGRETSFKSVAGIAGLTLENDNAATYTLDDLIKSFEQLRTTKRQTSEAFGLSANLEPKSGDAAGTKALLNGLFEAINVSGETAEKPVFSISDKGMTENSERGFLSMLTGQKGEESGQLFETLRDEKFKAQKTQKESVKEIDALMDEKTKASSTGEIRVEVLERSRNAGASFKKEVDTHQVSASHVKQTTGQGDQFAGLKTFSQAAKSLPNYVTQQVGKSLVRAVNQGETSLKIQLKPPELGRLMMTIDNTGNSMRVSIMTENQSAKEILAQNVTELKSVLSNSGVNLERFDVDMSSDFRQSMADARQQTGGNSRKKNQKELSGVRTQDGSPETSMSPSKGLNPDGTVHLVA